MTYHILYVCTNTKNQRIEKHWEGNTFIIHYLGLPVHRRQFLSYEPPAIEAHIIEAKKILETKHIDGIFFSNDLGALVGSILAKQYGLPGPNPAAVLRANHKIYMRRTLAHDHPAYVTFFPQDETPPLPFPYYIKAPLSSLGLLGFTIRSRVDIEKRRKLIIDGLKKMNVPFCLALKEIPELLASYPIACAPMMLAEEVLLGPQVTVEGFVCAGKIFITVITDTNFFPNSRLIDNFSFPSRLPESDLAELRQAATRDIHKLGLDTTFFNIEYCYGNNGWHLLEVNPRAAFCFSRMYQNALGFDLLRAGVELCLGKMPPLPGVAHTVAGQFNLITTQEGILEQLFNEKIKPPALLRSGISPGQRIHQLSEHGVVLGQFELFGSSYDTILRQANAYRATAMKTSL